MADTGERVLSRLMQFVSGPPEDFRAISAAVRVIPYIDYPLFNESSMELMFPVSQQHVVNCFFNYTCSKQT